MAKSTRSICAHGGWRSGRCVDLALHLGDVLYGNVGAADRLDFTVIGPAVNEVARIEALCEPLGRAVLVSAEFVAAATGRRDRLELLGRYALRGVREAKEIFALDLASRQPSRAVSRRACLLRSCLGDSGAAHVVKDPGPLGKEDAIVALYGGLKIRDTKWGSRDNPAATSDLASSIRPMFANAVA